MIRRGLSIIGWIVTAISTALVVGLVVLMIYIDGEMDLVCGANGGYYHSGECKDLGSVGRVAILAMGFFAILASVSPIIHFIAKSRSHTVSE